MIPKIISTIVSKILTGISPNHHAKSTIYVPKLSIHIADVRNAEYSTENMYVEFSRGIKSPPPPITNN